MICFTFGTSPEACTYQLEVLRLLYLDTHYCSNLLNSTVCHGCGTRKGTGHWPVYEKTLVAWYRSWRCRTQKSLSVTSSTASCDASPMYASCLASICHFIQQDRTMSRSILFWTWPLHAACLHCNLKSSRFWELGTVANGKSTENQCKAHH